MPELCVLEDLPMESSFLLSIVSFCQEFRSNNEGEPGMLFQDFSWNTGID